MRFERVRTGLTRCGPHEGTLGMKKKTKDEKQLRNPTRFDSIKTRTKTFFVT